MTKEEEEIALRTKAAWECATVVAVVLFTAICLSICGAIIYMLFP